MTFNNKEQMAEKIRKFMFELDPKIISGFYKKVLYNM